MARTFDAYSGSYGRAVQESIGFSGLGHDFFLEAKVRVLARLIGRRLPGGTPPRALDIGCGVGAMHPFLKGLLPGLEGCDISGDSIARAKQDNPWAHYTAYDPPRLPYPDARFDLAMAVCVVHHVDTGQWVEFFREMKRVVRPGGIACVIEHNPFNPLTRLAVLRCPFDEDAVLLGSRHAARLFHECGFSEISVEHFLLLPSSGRLAGAAERAVRALPLGAQYVCSARV